MSFCAICTDERGPFVRQPLGRDDAMVTVCVSCDSQRPRENRSHQHGYSAGVIGMSQTEMKARACKTVKELDPLYGREFQTFGIIRKRTPNTLLERVKQRPEGRPPLSVREAFNILRKRLPDCWEFTFMGANNGDWCWERPDPAFTKRLRQSDPVQSADLERLTRSKP